MTTNLQRLLLLLLRLVWKSIAFRSRSSRIARRVYQNYGVECRTNASQRSVFFFDLVYEFGIDRRSLIFQMKIIDQQVGDKHFRLANLERDEKRRTRSRINTFYTTITRQCSVTEARSSISCSFANDVLENRLLVE